MCYSQSGCLKAYVNVLCNFAELYECTGELMHKEEYISSALAALQGYQRTDSHAHLAHRPLLGRVLSLAAHRELSVGQAVSAEGLYRSAIDHLSSPLALHDPRYSIICLWFTRFSTKFTSVRRRNVCVPVYCS